MIYKTVPCGDSNQGTKIQELKLLLRLCSHDVHAALFRLSQRNLLHSQARSHWMRVSENVVNLLEAPSSRLDKGKIDHKDPHKVDR